MRMINTCTVCLVTVLFVISTRLSTATKIARTISLSFLVTQLIAIQSAIPEGKDEPEIHQRFHLTTGSVKR